MVAAALPPLLPSNFTDRPPRRSVLVGRGGNHRDLTLRPADRRHGRRTTSSGSSAYSIPKPATSLGLHVRCRPGARSGVVRCAEQSPFTFPSQPQCPTAFPFKALLFPFSSAPASVHPLRSGGRPEPGHAQELGGKSEEDPITYALMWIRSPFSLASIPPFSPGYLLQETRISIERPPGDLRQPRSALPGPSLAWWAWSGLHQTPASTPGPASSIMTFHGPSASAARNLRPCNHVPGPPQVHLWCRLPKTACVGPPARFFAGMIGYKRPSVGDAMGRGSWREGDPGCWPTTHSIAEKAEQRPPGHHQIACCRSVPAAPAANRHRLRLLHVCLFRPERFPRLVPPSASPRGLPLLSSLLTKVPFRRSSKTISLFVRPAMGGRWGLGLWKAEDGQGPIDGASAPET